jgi:hypothetical protein
MIHMNEMTHHLRGSLRASGLAAVALATIAVGASGPALAQSKDLSDKSVQTMMQYAWTLMLPKFTANGKEVIVDLNKPKENMVPVDVAREVIRVGRISASAQLCGLENDQTAVHANLMARENAKKKWTDQQMMFVNQLHLFTVMLMTGGVKVVEKEGDKEGAKEVVLDNAKLAAPKAACTDAERSKVAEAVKTYVATGAPAEAKKP